MADDTLRSVRIERTGAWNYTVSSASGGKVSVGGPGDLTPVELLLAAIGTCAAADADVATSRHAEPTEFAIVVTGDRIGDEGGNRMANLTVSLRATFPEGECGDAARAILPRAVRLSHERQCTVSRTVELGTPVAITIADPAG